MFYVLECIVFNVDFYPKHNFHRLFTFDDYIF